MKILVDLFYEGSMLCTWANHMKSERHNKIELPKFEMPKKVARQAEAISFKVEDRGAFRASSTLLSKQRISDASQSNAMKATFIQQYVGEMQLVDNAFVDIRVGDSCTDIDEIISVLSRADDRNKEMMARLGKAQDQMIIERSRISKAHEELAEALKITHTDLVHYDDTNSEGMKQNRRINTQLVM